MKNSNPNDFGKNAPPRVGEPFDPRPEKCGFYPEDVVGQRKELRDGPKRLYQKARFWAGANGVFWHSFGVMAQALGKSERQVRYDMAELEKVRLIQHRIKAGRRSNTYELLWHQWFNEASKEGRVTIQPPPRKQTSALSGSQSPVKEAVPGDLSGSTLPLKQVADHQNLPAATGSGLPSEAT